MDIDVNQHGLDRGRAKLQAMPGCYRVAAQAHVQLPAAELKLEEYLITHLPSRPATKDHYKLLGPSPSHLAV